MNSSLKIPVLILLAAGMVCSTRAYTNCRRLDVALQSCFVEIYSMYGSSTAGQIQFAELGSAQQLDHVCRELESATQCAGRLLQQCHQQEVSDLILTTLTDTFGYMCGEGRQALIDEISCWQNPRFLTTMEICEHKSKMAAQRARSMTDICRILDDYQSCVQTKVTSLCNENAGTFIYNIFEHASAAVNSRMGCDAHLVNTRSIIGLIARRGAHMR